MHTSSRSFTLIEMLIVIVIIGILAAALVPRLQSVQWRARDSKRKVDLKAIYTANEIYFLDNGAFAKNTNCGGWCYSVNSQPWIPDLSGLMTSIPVDPLNIAPNPFATWYTYWYGDVYTGLTRQHSYDMATRLENASDPDRCAIKQYVYRTTTWLAVLRCGAYPATIYEYSPDSNSF